MGVIVQMAFLNSLSCENYHILISIYLKIVPISPIDNEPSLYQIMAGRRTGDKPISEPMMEYFTNAYMRISASWKTIASSSGRITIMATEGLAKQGTRASACTKGHSDLSNMKGWGVISVQSLNVVPDIKLK